MEKLVHIKSASEQLGISEEELNVLVEMKKVPHAVKNLCKMIRQSTIDEIIGLRRIGGEGNKIENLERVNPDKIK